MTVASGGAQRGDSAGMMAMVRRVGLGGALAGLLGGAVMIGLMILVMGASGSGYASPLNLGIPAFVKTITPPTRMLPTLMGLMGVHLPPPVMAQLGPAVARGHVSPAMIHHLGAMLMAMHVPTAKVQMMGVLMSGHASNTTMANLLAGMNPSARSAAMNAMPVSAGHVTIGAVTHFALSTVLGVTFAMAIIGLGIRMLSIPVLRTSAGIVAASVIGGALVYVINRWVILPAIDPMMRLVPETAFFIAHLLFGLVVGAGVALIAHREGVLDNPSGALSLA